MTVDLLGSEVFFNAGWALVFVSFVALFCALGFLVFRTYGILLGAAVGFVVFASMHARGERTSLN
ncbi:hypothetical protein ACFQH3_13515 [Haladaptatus sp. GCM10025707]|uniref:hypothetical protein n=1 Tax=unclassified Haladaptatus TaxID=2622732 RepID=UPI0023E8C7A9|nr:MULTISPECIES: hypothetical protein [unclassified Haladaptatus]